MIVEDDDDIRHALIETLENRGFDVRGAANGRHALEILRTEPLPFVILVDLMMPVMDGWSFRQEQLRDPVLRKTPVVVLSATGSSQEAVRAQFGDVEVVAKPVCVADLIRAIERAGRPAEVAA